MDDQTGRIAVLHVGAPKTGSTYLQSVLWRNRDALLDAGVHVLGDNQGQHHRASRDLREARFDPIDPGVDWTGAWDRMAQWAADSPARTVVISEERLAALTPAQVRRAAESLAPRGVHMVYVTRNLPGLLPSEWQEYVKHGTASTYADWAGAVLASRDEGPGAWFWMVHDLESVVSRWATSVPLESIHVITMPPSDGPRDELWRRFCTVLRVDPGVATDLEIVANPSLGLAGAEALRRVNAALPAGLPQWHRIGIVRDLLANRILNPLSPPGRPALPPGLADEVMDRAERTQHLLPDLGCDVIGDPDDLAPDLRRLEGAGTCDESEVADVATRAIAELVASLAASRDELRRERADRHETEQRLIADHARDMAAALESQEAAFWRDHPWTHRTQRFKERTVSAEQSNRLIARGLDGYRALRARLVGGLGQNR